MIPVGRSSTESPISNRYRRVYLSKVRTDRHTDIQESPISKKYKCMYLSKVRTDTQTDRLYRRAPSVTDLSVCI